MTVRQLWSVYCDATTRTGHRCGSWAGQQPTADEARKLALECGWTLGKRDLCPFHAREAKGAKA